MLQIDDTSPGARRDYMEQLVVRSKARMVIAATLFAGLAGCSSVPNAVNPVSWFRDLTGASKNDDLGKGDNDQNLQEGGSEPYPNLASVPPAPDTALSTVDRDKLVNSLVADRNHAQYSDEDLQPGRTAGTTPPPPPPPTGATASASPAATSGPSAASVSSTPPSSALVPAAPPTAAAQPAPAPQPAQQVPPATIASNTPPSAPVTPTRQRVPPRGSEAPPAESSLSTPSVPSLPQGETARPAPPPPSLPRLASAPPPPQATRVSPPPPQTVSVPANSGPLAASRAPSVSYRIADVSFGPGSALVSGALRGTIAEIVKLHADSGGRIRIVGFGEASGGNAMDGLTLALDRAQAVAIALTDSGVAAKDISVEAAPVPARGGTDIPRAEVYFEN
jgi:outer membrane protein OmpA-like peptidoglycan-associated protein